MRVKFTADHDDVTPEKTVAYKAGAEETVRKELADELVAAGKARSLEKAAPAAAEGGGGR